MTDPALPADLWEYENEHDTQPYNPPILPPQQQKQKRRRCYYCGGAVPCSWHGQPPGPEDV
jgi:hypothetical protein